MRTSLACVAAAMMALGGCGDESPGDTGAGGSTSSSTTATTGGQMGDGLAGDIKADATLSGDVQLTETATILPGVTLTLKAGTQVSAASGALLVIRGALVVEGSADAPVDFHAAAGQGPGGWGGLDVAGGGDVTLDYASIHDATLAFKAEPDSTFSLDHITIDRSSALADLASDGTIAHGVLHSLGSMQSAQPVEIQSASPTISDTLLDQANGGVDIINVDGSSSSPQFDHVEITQCHCAFHFNAGSGITVTGSYMHGNEYGMMVVQALDVSVQDSNFEDNAVANIGACAGGSVVATGVYFSGSAFDASCSGQGNTSPAGAPVSGVGPRP